MNRVKEDYFLNIQTNSNLSFSLIKTSKLVEWAVKNRLEYLAIADYYPYEFLHFYQLCKENKIKPLIGVKVIIQDGKKQYLTTVYPQNSVGYKELMKKVFSGSESPENRVFSFEEIMALKKNCLLVFLAHNLRDIYYFSQQPFLAENENSPFYFGFDFCISEPKKNIPPRILPLLLPFFAVKAFYREDSTVLNSLKLSSLAEHFLPLDVQQKFISLSSLKKEEFSTLCTDDKIFCNILFAQTRSFLSRINLKFSFGSSRAVSNETNGFSELQNRCERQLFFLQKEPREKYEKQLEKELQVIKKLGYTSYFLTFNDIVNDLRQQNITVGPGRGSAVSSLVTYLLGITKIDPLEYNLFFERFLNEKRKSSPDIDIDVENQKAVIKYLQDKYGTEKIARVATRQKLGWKNAFKEIAKVINQKSKKKEIIGEKELKDILSCVKEETLQENLKTQALRSRFASLFKIVEKINDFYFNSSLHASGIVISEKKPLNQLLPLKQEKNLLVSYYSEKDLNLVGLKKYDFLNLTSLGDLREIKEVLGKKNLPRCNLQDRTTWKLLYNGLVSGIPQLDTFSFRELISYFQPQNFLDLVLILALNRPGARSNIEHIWEQKLKNQKKMFSSPELNQILAETYGSIVFEEQISQILAFVFDCSFAEAEIHRRNLSAISKKT